VEAEIDERLVAKMAGSDCYEVDCTIIEVDGASSTLLAKDRQMMAEDRTNGVGMNDWKVTCQIGKDDVGNDIDFAEKNNW
jgi:hypothetical protein